MLYKLTKRNLPACYNRKKRLYCILMAVFFAVGILGNLMVGGSLMHYGRFGTAARRLAPENRYLFAEEFLSEDRGLSDKTILCDRKDATKGFAGTGRVGLSDDTILPDRMFGRFAAERALQGMDDFWIAPDAGCVGQNVYQGFKMVTVLPFEGEDGLLFCRGQQRRRLWPGDKKIRLFHVVKFIHRTDGKKKSCFA